MLLARLLNSECPKEPLLGQLLVAESVIHRVDRKNFSKKTKWTVKRVILQRDKKGRPQYDGIDTKRFYKHPPEELIAVARYVLLGNTISPKSLEFYHNNPASSDRGWVNYIEKWKLITVGHHTFCLNPKSPFYKESDHLIASYNLKQLLCLYNP